MNKTVALYKLAHARMGDKGNRSNISVIAYRPEDFSLLQRELTEEKVKSHFDFRNPSAVKRYDLPHLTAFNFVIDDALDGGVNLSLNLDSHAKSLSYWLLAMEINVDA
uniref:AtuA-like ferredoxin-fold domain-containing protein n=1 Tax=Polynucleobacter necessarius subsp. necessarius (strain STIR1) TaxID=452638 RepID=B1XVV1_POLNS